MKSILVSSLSRSTDIRLRIRILPFVAKFIQLWKLECAQHPELGFQRREC